MIVAASANLINSAIPICEAIQFNYDSIAIVAKIRILLNPQYLLEIVAAK